MLRVALALVAARLVSPSLLFADEASPNAGLVSTQFMSPAVPRRPLPRKKFYIGSGNQNNFKFVNERQVDSYFHVLRDSPRAPATVPHARTETPAHLQQNETAHSPLPRSNNYHDKTPPPAANTSTHDDDFRKLNRDYFRWQHVYEKQSVGRAREPVVEANFHRSDRGPLRAQSFPAAQVKDKILHKAGISELAHAPGMKEYHMRATIDKGDSRHQQSSDIPRSTLQVTRDGGSGFSKSIKPSYAAFYGMSRDPEAPSQLTGAGAGVGETAVYYRSSGANFVDILTGRKGVKTIGARALDHSLQSLLF